MKTANTLMLLGLFAVSPLSLAASGIAFIHGTGHQTDALNDYWTGEFVNSVRQGLPNSANYTVINCDFDQYMWDEAEIGRAHV